MNIRVLDPERPGPVKVAWAETPGDQVNWPEAVPTLVCGARVLSARAMQLLADCVNDGRVKIPEDPLPVTLSEGTKVVVTFRRDDGSEFDLVELIRLGRVCVDMGPAMVSLAPYSDGTFLDQTGLPGYVRPVRWRLCKEAGK